MHLAHVHQSMAVTSFQGESDLSVKRTAARRKGQIMNSFSRYTGMAICVLLASIVVSANAADLPAKA
jgi:hypothetical protein